MTHDVFVSYSQQDKTVADAVVARLEQDGTRCWIASRDILPGTAWGEAIVNAIAASRVMVLVMSGNANRSRQVVREVERAVADGVIILPFRIEAVDPTGSLAYYLATEHWLDAITPPLEQHIERLTRSVRALLSDEPVGRDDLDRPPAVVARRRTSRRKAAIIAGLAVAGTAALIAVVLSTRDGAPDAVSTTSAVPVTTIESTSTSTSTSTTVPPPAVGLEEVGRYQPMDPDPTDLVAPGSVTHFDVDGDQLVYSNGVVTLMSLNEGNPLPRVDYGFSGAAQCVTFAEDRMAAVGGPPGPMFVTLFTVDGFGGPDVEIDDPAVTSLCNIEYADGYLFIASHNYVGIIDATAPDTPQLVFEWTPPGSTGNPADVFVADGILYVAAGWDGLYLFDIADPSAPSLLGHWSSPNWVIDVVVVDTVAHLTLGESGFVTLDVSDPASPQLLGTTALTGFAGPLDIAQGYAFVGSFGDGASMGTVTVVDVTDPASPTPLATFGSFPAMSHLAVASDYLVVSDESEGLVIFRITGLE